MSLIGLEGFGSTSPTSDTNGIIFDSGRLGGVGSTSGGAYSGAQYGAIENTNEGIWNTSGNPDTIIQGIRIATDRPDLATETPIFRIYDGTTIQCVVTIQMQTSNVFRVYRGNQTTLLGTSSATSGMVNPLTWWYVEWKVKLHGSTGTIEIRLNGGTSPILNLTGQNTISTANAYSTKIGVKQVYNYEDDYYACDGGGSAPFNTFLGDVRVYELVPTSDDSVQFTPNSGANNYSRLTTADGDTTYVEDSTVGHVDTYNMTDLPTGAIPLGIEHRTHARKTDAGLRELRSGFISGATTHNGNSIVLPSGSNYSVLRQLYELDPTDSAAWTKTKVDALKSRLEVLA